MPGGQFTPDSGYAEKAALLVRAQDPIPEARAHVEAIVEILGPHEDIGVEEEGAQSTTPIFLDSSWNVATFFKPRSRKASRNWVRPSSVLAMTARANRFPRRLP